MLTTRTSTQLLALQLRAVEAWGAHRVAELSPTSGGSREDKMDRSRRLELLERQHVAVLARLDRQWLAPFRDVSGARAVLALRQEWYAEKVAATLAEHGVSVLDDCDNGADVLGTVLAEQPELLVLECRLPMHGGVDLVEALCRFAPGTLVVVVGAYDEEVAVLRRAGAALAFPRQRPTDQVLGELVELLS